MAQGSQVSNEVVTMDFLKRSIFVAEVASLSVWAELFPVELATILRFVLLVQSCLGFSDSVDFCELFRTVGVLALETVSAETDFCPVLAHFSLILFGV